ncbi:MAG: DUF58 domain-containing protein [Campylobacterota bacterium]|nr:DUF58 domain-containing protein [Campylobacterota bacterium]
MKFLQTSIRILKAVKTRPTRYFPLLVIAIIALFMLAYMHNYNIVYLMMFFIFSLAGASSIIGRFNLLDLKLTLLSQKRFFAQTPSSYTLQLFNPSASRTSYALEISDGTGSQNIDRLSPQHHSVVHLEISAPLRGVIPLPPIQLGSHFPLPHELLYREIDLPSSITVYPEPKGESLETLSSINRATTGEQDDFEGIRSYQKGDPLSLIHWASVAKGSDLMSKEFLYNERSHKLHFDFLTAGDNDESRLSQLTLWILECEQKGIPFIIQIAGEKMDSTKMSTDAILEILAKY